MILKTGGSRLYGDETTAPILDPGRGKTKTGIYGQFCATTVAGADLHCRVWSSIIGLGVAANMSPNSSTASTLRSRSVLIAAVPILPRQSARVVIRCDWLAGHTDIEN
ncbi:hypothetical protein L614_000200003360 [Ochrobactrum sp. J50]|nr:hypothetical protein L614_000200003360 [Ochrobactrum sp. J50]